MNWGTLAPKSSLSQSIQFPLPPHLKKKIRKKIKPQSPTYVKTFVQLVQPSSLKTYTTRARLQSTGGSGWEKKKKSFECQNRFPPNPKSSNNSLREAGNYREEEEVCGRLKGRCTCVASWGSCWLRVTPPPRAEALGGPRVPPGVEEVMQSQ